MQWTKWEYWGDDQSETIAMLHPPTKYRYRLTPYAVRLAHWHRPIAFSWVLCTGSSTAAKWATFFLKQFYNSVDPFSYILFRRCAVCHPRGAVRLHRATRRCAGTTSSKTN